MAISMNYGGIDRIYGNISPEAADEVLDLVDEYVDLVEELDFVQPHKKLPVSLGYIPLWMFRAQESEDV